MTINKQQEFDTFVKKFVTDNWTTLSTSKKYRQAYENDRDGCINYLPEQNQKPDSDYLGNSEVFARFLTEFLDAFIFIDGLVFDLNGHFPDLTGRTFADVVASANDSKNRSFRYFSHENLTKRFHKRLLMDVFTAFITVRDKEDHKPIYYHLFAYDDNLLEIKDNSPCRFLKNDQI